VEERRQQQETQEEWQCLLIDEKAAARSAWRHSEQKRHEACERTVRSRASHRCWFASDVTVGTLCSLHALA
jgi:hypothetical protein